MNNKKNVRGEQTNTTQHITGRVNQQINKTRNIKTLEGEHTKQKSKKVTGRTKQQNT